MPSHQERVRKNNEYENKDETRDDILKMAHVYLQHQDKWVRILAQIALYHYGD